MFDRDTPSFPINALYVQVPKKLSAVETDLFKENYSQMIVENIQTHIYIYLNIFDTKVYDRETFSYF